MCAVFVLCGVFRVLFAALLVQMEHRNRLVLGDVVLAFGELSLAGASDEAISQWIDDHSSEPNMPDSVRASETDSDEDDDDPFGDGGLMTVLVMRSIVVHVVAMQARLAVAEHNLRQLLTQGLFCALDPPFLHEVLAFCVYTCIECGAKLKSLKLCWCKGFAAKRPGDREQEHPVRAAARAFRLDHTGGDCPAAAVALMRTVRESVFWNYIISLEARLPVDTLPGSISDDGSDSDSVGDDESSASVRSAAGALIHSPPRFLFSDRHR